MSSPVRWGWNWFNVEEAVDPAVLLVEADDCRRVAGLLDRLPELQRRVVELRFGLGDGVARSWQEVAWMVGASRERVQVLALWALHDLRRRLEVCEWCGGQPCRCEDRQYRQPLRTRAFD